MTTEPTPAEEPTTPAPPSSGSSMSGESMLMVGAVLVLACYVIFELLAGEYSQPWVVLTSAVLVLTVPRMGVDTATKIAPMPVILKTLAYVIVITGVLDALNAIRFNGLNEVLEIIGGLVAYAGYVLVFLGARALDA